MKKLLVIIILFLATKGYSQTFKYNGVSNPVVDVAIFKGTDAYGIENALTVPEGTFVTFAEHANGIGVGSIPMNHQITKFQQPKQHYLKGLNFTQHIILTVHV